MDRTTLKNAGLNSTQRWVKYGRAQLLVENHPAYVLSNIYPAFSECSLDYWWVMYIFKYYIFASKI